MGRSYIVEIVLILVSSSLVLKKIRDVIQRTDYENERAGLIGNSDLVAVFILYVHICLLICIDELWRRLCMKRIDR